MYGFVIEGLHYMVIEHFGQDAWVEVVKKSLLTNVVFSSHEIYSEKIAPNILAAVTEVSQMQFQDVGILAGKYFVHFASLYGYDALLRVSGRRFSDFIKGMDNMHEFFKFSYPKIRPPSFFCEKEDSRGVVLHYRSRRQGYIAYVMGQLIEIAKLFFALSIEIKVMKREEKRGISYSVLRVNFNNKDYKADRALKSQITQLSTHLSVDSVSFLDMFPFYMVFNKSFTVELVGSAIRKLIPELVGQKLNEEFNLLIPLVKFTYEAVRAHQTNIFKIQSYKNIKRKKESAMIDIKLDDMLLDKVELQDKEEAKPVDHDHLTVEDLHGDLEVPMIDDDGYPLTLRGQMVYVKRSEVFVYLATCEVETLDQMFESGICVSDYSIADCNRDMIMVTVQQSDDLKNLLTAEQEKSQILKENMRELDKARKQTIELLSQMMPKSVAMQLTISSGDEHPNIVQKFDEATVCFTKVKDFPVLTERLSIMAIVTLLNQIYNLFDAVIEKHGVYKVETIGESYMISGGVPHETEYHTEYVADAALDMLAVMNNFTEETTGEPVKVKQGMHSGPVVGGIVGFKAPRYCLIGDAVNTASRMESHNEVVKTLMASEHSKAKLEQMHPDAFRFMSRGKIEVKGKGSMETFEVVSKTGDARSDLMPLDDEDDDDIQVYTPQDMLEDRNSHASSRMSVGRDIIHSGASSRNTGSRMSTSSRGSGTGSVIDNALQELEAMKLSDIKADIVVGTNTAGMEVKVKHKFAQNKPLKGLLKEEEEEEEEPGGSPPPTLPNLGSAAPAASAQVHQTAAMPASHKSLDQARGTPPIRKLGTPPQAVGPAFGTGVGGIVGSDSSKDSEEKGTPAPRKLVSPPPQYIPPGFGGSGPGGLLGAHGTQAPAPGLQPQGPPKPRKSPTPPPAPQLGSGLAAKQPTPAAPRPLPAKPVAELVSRDSVERLLNPKPEPGDADEPPISTGRSDSRSSRKMSLESVDLAKAGVPRGANRPDPAPTESLAQLHRVRNETPPNMPMPKPPTPPRKPPSPTITALAPPSGGSAQRSFEREPKEKNPIPETKVIELKRRGSAEKVLKGVNIVVDDENEPVLPVLRKGCMCGVQNGGTIETDVCTLL